MSESDVRQFTVGPDDDGIRLDRWFKRNLPQVGFAMVSRWARTGQLRVDGKRADPADRLATGQVLRIPPGGTPPPSTTRPTRPRAELSAEDLAEAKAMVLTQTPSAIVLNKPPGLATQGGSGMTRHVDGLLDAYMEGDGPRPRLVHRLDKDTSGVLLIARTPGAAASYSKRFSGRTARKIYWALVVGVPSIEDGMIDLPIGKQPGTGGEKMYVDEENGQPARSRYRVIDHAGNNTAWVELQPLTGRTHQLRVHLAAIGHPIVGDGKYGGPDAFLTGTISRKMHLHARRLRIEQPRGGMLDVTAPLPRHFAASLEQLGFTEADGDLPLDEPRGPMTREEQKVAAKAHAKQYRKERRGERRSRSGGPGDSKHGGKPERSGPSGFKSGGSKSAGPKSGASRSDGARSAGSRSDDPRSGGGKPGGGKPVGGRPTGGRPGGSGPGSRPAPRSGAPRGKPRGRG